MCKQREVGKSHRVVLEPGPGRAGDRNYTGGAEFLVQMSREFSAKRD